MSPAALLALDLQDGTYQTRNDGAKGTLKIENGTASLGISSQTCSGGMEGPIRTNQDGTMSVRKDYETGSCTLTIEDSEEGLAWISAGPGCGYFHGATCGLSGAVVGRAIPISFDAIDAGFSQLDQSAREAVQQVLKSAGHYRGGIDGVTGPGTRVAIRAAGQEAFGENQDIRLDRREDVRSFLISLLQADVPQTASFFGTWDCDGSSYTFSSEGYQSNPNRDPLAYREIKEFTPGNFGVTFIDGYRLGLMDVTEQSMLWSSPASGDTFDCVRTGDAITEANAGNSAEGQTSSDAPQQEPSTEAVSAYLGRWSCSSDDADDLTYTFEANAATIEELGRTTSYASVSDLGQGDSAFKIDFTDGETAHLFEVSQGSMWLAAAGEVFECSAN